MTRDVPDRKVAVVFPNEASNVSWFIDLEAMCLMFDISANIDYKETSIWGLEFIVLARRLLTDISTRGRVTYLDFRGLRS